MKLATRTVALVSLLASAAACSGSNDDSLGTAEGEKRIDPVDDENLGSVVFKLPAALTTTGAVVYYRGKPQTLGTASRVTAGAGELNIDGSFQRGVVDKTISVTKKQTTTVTLAALKVAYDTSPTSVLRSDIGPVPHLSVRAKVGGVDQSPVEPWNLQAKELSDWVPDPAGVLTIAGDYSFSFDLNAFATTQVTVSPGQTKSVNLNVDKRARVRLVPPASRDLPNFTAPCVGKDRTFVVQRSANTPVDASADPFQDTRYYADRGVDLERGIVEWRSAPMTQPVELTMFPLAAADKKGHYEVVTNGVPTELNLAPGQTTTVNLARLDVGDVELTRENGTKYKVAGTYGVEWKNKSGAFTPLWFASSMQWGLCASTGTVATYPTGTGLDLPPGDYRVKITYSTEEGPKEQVHLVTLP